VSGANPLDALLGIIFWKGYVMGMLNPCEMLDKTMRSIKEHNDALEDIPICDRLKNAGYTYERVSAYV